MKFLIDKDSLDRRMNQLGYSSYYELVEEAKKRGILLAVRTVYNMAEGGNYSREKLEDLCAALMCSPADLIPGWRGNGDTHASPRSEEEPERVRT